jgi:hypothetical protein
MQKVINKTVYDTDTATKIGAKCVGEFGQPDGYEEQLLMTEGGLFFIYGVGGPQSIYAEPTIKRASKMSADEWKAQNM